jgi:hypothetical protein
MLSGLMTFLAHVPCLHCFHMASTIPLVFFFLACPFIHSLSPFPYCLAPLDQTLRSPFALAQCLYCSCMRPSGWQGVLLPPLSTFTVAVYNPFCLRLVSYTSWQTVLFAPAKSFCCDCNYLSLSCYHILLPLFSSYSVFFQSVSYTSAVVPVGSKKWNEWWQCTPCMVYF